MIVAGAGGYGCEIATILLELGRPFAGAVDDGEPDLERISGAGVEFLGPMSIAPNHAETYVVGIGYPKPRMAVAHQLEEMGLVPADPVIHPSAVLLNPVVVGQGSVVMPNATISRGTTAGRHLLVNYNASVGHDVNIGECVTIGPNAAIGGECTIGDEVLIGSGAVVLQGLTIGHGAVIGSGAVVNRDVPANTTVVGVPARQID